MSRLSRMLAPSSVAIVGLSADPTKHGARVLANLRKLDFRGRIVGVNPGLPAVDGVEVVAVLTDVLEPPDLVVSAVPAEATPEVVASATGCGGVIVFAGGFSEAGPEGDSLQRSLAEAARRTGVPVLGPNSGGIIRPTARLAASFLTCLDRPADEIRSGPVGVVTQSGGTGSYLHNLAAASGSGLGISVSTGNEAVTEIADGIAALCELPEVKVVALVIETVRDGPAFMDAVAAAHDAGRPVVACRLGSSERGSDLMGTHTGAMAIPAEVLDGVLVSLGVVVTETPEEMLGVAEILGRSRPVRGKRLGVVTHSGGMALLLSDLAEREGVELPHPSERLAADLGSLLHHGSADNPLDMGGIIGGPGRFAEVVDRCATSGEFDAVLAVSTAHPPAHSLERAEGLLALDPAVPVVHLWMAGDLGDDALRLLRKADQPLTTEPRAAMKAMAALLQPSCASPPIRTERRVVEAPADEHAAKELASQWGLPVVEGGLASTAEEAVEIARRLGSPVALKVNAPGLLHKTDVGGVALGVAGDDAVRRAFREVVGNVGGRLADVVIEGVRVERMAAGPEVIVGLFADRVFGPMAMLGPGGLSAEGMKSRRFGPAPLSDDAAMRLVRRVPGIVTALQRQAPESVPALAALLAHASTAFAGTNLQTLEMNPVTWTDDAWKILDIVMVSGRAEGEA